MKAFLIGAAGFVGKHLIDHLRAGRGWSVAASKLPHETIEAAGVPVYDLDILDRRAVESLLAEVRTDCVIHLAAQSSVAVSWEDPGLTIDVNIKGAVNVLDAVRGLDYTPRVLLIGSGEEYGAVLPEEIPVGEHTPLRPGNIYAATKACQNMLGKLYADAYGMDIVMVRAFNHIGPGQSPQFVVSDFCKQVAGIEAGRREPVLRVGNLAAKRDFTDVRDVVRAYGLLLDRGKAGETYNVGSGEAVAVADILHRVLALSAGAISVETDPKKFRPVDVPEVRADIAKLRAATGWAPEVPLDKTLAETLDFWRNTGEAP